MLIIFWFASISFLHYYETVNARLSPIIGLHRKSLKKISWDDFTHVKKYKIIFKQQRPEYQRYIANICFLFIL